MTEWIIIAIIAAIVVVVGAFYIMKIIKMSPEERKQLLIDWVMGAIVAAQNNFTEDGHNAEKFAQVEQYFKSKAPMLYKIILKITKGTNLKDVIETALTTIKETKF